MSLRERKRRERQRTILLAAADAFKAKGVDGARLEEIAEKADVSLGTIYNYFPTKDALLLALVTLYRTEAREERLPLMENPPADVCETFCQLYSHLIDGALKYLDRAIWRHGQVVGLVSSWEPGRQESWDNEQILIKDQEALLLHFQAQGRLPADLQPALWATTLHAVGLFWWQYFLANDTFSADEAKQRLREHFQGLFAHLVIQPA
ncbi:TetR/AcrR family transcriptional regulator [Pseudomonas mangiferae]|uniref:TetR/AcrR family transcriptional regulator n=1 Tax=Pseudomonas mangiferae TaxID=2593654 RepID=A0A553GXF0_9PSED|nr:TetR/AcrR family transcriptional regulator [Pseudomonas mangiferae]TRX74184.1 TetR/AcrR family transcriptional regulator [Pseudomonas mangiferae]